MKSHKTGFTLLEVVIVIIIIGVLASLALPRLWNMIELSYTTEAMGRIAQIRRAQETCLLNNDMDYAKCGFAEIYRFLGDSSSVFGLIEFGNQDHFLYDSLLLSSGAFGLDGWIIEAYRKPFQEQDGSDGPWYDSDDPQGKGAMITMIICGTAKKIKLCGYGPYKSISDKDVNCAWIADCN